MTPDDSMVKAFIDALAARGFAVCGVLRLRFPDAVRYYAADNTEQGIAAALGEALKVRSES